MDGKTQNLSPDLEDMRRLVHEKAEYLLKDLSTDNVNYFVKESAFLARMVMEKYVFAVYDYYTKGEYTLKDLSQREAFTNFKTGYQQRMLDWIGQHKPDIDLMVEIPTTPQQPSDKKWHYVAFCVGTTGAVALAIGCLWFSTVVVEIVSLVVSYFIYKKEKGNIYGFSEKLKQYDIDLKTKKDAFTNETIGQLEVWMEKGEEFSNELLNTYNL